ncbi:MAG: zf-HC2 domain-containing protein, partial [Deltaproteobacteria bacterium]|nr:zf-HC2 domain-containing protein [Deltaproteobacteria bacterium]
MTRMECTQVDDLLMDYLYQELAPEQETEFRAHLDSCDRCAREVRELQGVREAVRELPVLEPPKALTAQLLHQAAAAKQPAFPWLRSLWELLQPRRTFYAVAAAASLVVVLFVGYAMQKGRFKLAFPAEERAVAEATTAAPATPTAPAAAAPARAAAPADEAKPAPGAKAALGGEALDRTANTLVETDGKLAAGK